MIGRPRLHIRDTGSTNARARELAAAGAPHGTLVTAAAQHAGRGRQGRAWVAPPGSALLCSLVLREPPPLLALAAAVAVTDTVGGEIKWPNDVLLDGRKVCGILIEGRPQQGWAVLGIGINVSARLDELPEGAATLGLPAGAIEPLLAQLLGALQRRLAEPAAATLAAFGERDALRGREVAWNGGAGVAQGIDSDGRLVVQLEGGRATTLAAGEVHLSRR